MVSTIPALLGRSARNGVTSVGASGKERQVINVASGKVSSDSTDAINGSQLYAVANTVGGILNNHNTLIVNHDNQITRLTKENLRQDADLLRHENQIQNHDIQLKKSN